MKKYFLVGLIVAIMPNICAAESASVSNLIREKQRKMEELEKCMGTSKGLKIAGISTLGVTAAGVAGNIVEAKVLSDYDTKIETADKKIESGYTELAKKSDENISQDVADIANTNIINTIKNDNPFKEWESEIEEDDYYEIDIIEEEAEDFPINDSAS